MDQNGPSVPHNSKEARKKGTECCLDETTKTEFSYDLSLVKGVI